MSVPVPTSKSNEERAWFLDDFEPRDLIAEKIPATTQAIQYVVGIVATRSAFNPRCRKERNGWVPLRFVDIAPLFGRSGTWNIIRRLLLDLEILECDEEFVIGEKAKWYRLGPAWRNHVPRLVTIRDKRLVAHIRSIEGDRDRQHPRPVHVAHLEAVPPRGPGR